MKIALVLMGTEIASVTFSLPRFGVFAPGSLPDSVEATETWLDGED